MDPDELLQHCTWLTGARVARLRLEWKLNARVLEEGMIYVGTGGCFVVMCAPTFGVGIEQGLETIIRMRGGTRGSDQLVN